MSQFICKSCRTTLQQSLRPQCKGILSKRTVSSQAPYMRQYFDSAQSSKPGNRQSIEADESSCYPELPRGDDRKMVDIDALLSKPSWSIKSLLPDSDTLPRNEISPSKLRHLLRLSALPPPSSQAEETAMLDTLHTQLHFVRQIQDVDTEGVEPLQMIRDETAQGMKDITIGMEELKHAFNKEETKGRNRRPRRKREVVEDEESKWDLFATAEETVETGMGKFFVVKTAIPKSSTEKELAKDGDGNAGIEDDGLSVIGNRDVQIARKNLKQGPAFMDEAPSITKYKARTDHRRDKISLHYDAASSRAIEKEEGIARVREASLVAQAAKSKSYLEDELAKQEGEVVS